MSGPTKTDAARLLTLSEQEVVRLTHYPAIAGLSRRELQALARHLREARYRARDIARQQRREMRGKAEPRGATLDCGRSRHGIVTSMAQQETPQCGEPARSAH